MDKSSDITPALGAEGPQKASVIAHRRERTAIRNITLLLLLRGLIVAGGIASAALVPRTMGPATYGRYDLITMLTFWFSMLGSLGMSQVTSRQAPQLEAEGALAKLQALFGSFLALRALSSAAVAILYFLTTRLWLREIDGVVLLVLSVAVLLRGPGALCYALFLGQGRIGRWALPEVVRQWGSVAFALPCFLVGGVRGAVCGYLVSETVIFCIGIFGARRSFARYDVRLALRTVTPLLRLGLLFYVSDLVLSAIDRSGAVLVRAVTNDYAQVGMFGVSYQVFMAALLSTHQIASSFVPLLTVLRTQRENAELQAWVGRLVKWLTLVATLGLLGSLILGRDIVPLVLGRAYVPAYRNLVALAAAMLLVPLVQTCSVLALTHDRPGMLIKAASLRFVCFWGLGVPLVMRWGSLGACLAVGLAMAVQAGYLLARNGAVVGPALRRWSMVVAAGVVFAPACYLRAGVGANIALFFAAAAGYLLVLRVLGAISARELRVVYRALRFPQSKPDAMPGARP
ncbi:MAG: lipopolysaccharide biosynthesis protein [Deltaproteobacteria bacterium]|nr:lipopolysaccharide biosynthesis protein [Deltaproteobacteria bacterium]